MIDESRKGKPEGGAMIVYLIECLIDGKKYVGKTTQTLVARWREHKTEARICRKMTPLYEAMRLHGEDAFTIRILGECAYQARLNRMERRFVREFDTLNNGYNAAAAGSGGKTHKLKGRLRGITLSQDHKDKIRATLMQTIQKKKAQSISVGGFHERAA